MQLPPGCLICCSLAVIRCPLAAQCLPCFAGAWRWHSEPARLSAALARRRRAHLADDGVDLDASDSSIPLDPAAGAEIQTIGYNICAGELLSQHLDCVPA